VARSSISSRQRLRRLAVVAVVTILAVVGITPAHAEPPWYKGVPKEVQTKASELFRRGNAFFEQNEYAKAADLYEDAVVLWDHPGIHFNLAVSLVNLDRVLEAYTHLKAALKHGPQGLEKTRYQDAQTYQRLLEGRLVDLTVTTSQPGVEVTFDGKPILTTVGSTQLTVLPGAHALVATKVGFETLTKNLTLSGGTPWVETVVLSPRQRRTRVVRRYRTWVPWTFVGIGVGASLLGGGALVLARSHEREFETQFGNECPVGCSWRQPGVAVDWDLHDRAEIEHAVGLGVAGVGGGLIITGLVMLALNQPREVEVPPIAVISNGSTFGLVWSGVLP